MITRIPKRTMDVSEAKAILSELQELREKKPGYNAADVERIMSMYPWGLWKGALRERFVQHALKKADC